LVGAHRLELERPGSPWGGIRLKEKEGRGKKGLQRRGCKKTALRSGLSKKNREQDPKARGGRGKIWKRRERGQKPESGDSAKAIAIAIKGKGVKRKKGRGKNQKKRRAPLGGGDGATAWRALERPENWRAQELDWSGKVRSKMKKKGKSCGGAILALLKGSKGGG